MSFSQRVKNKSVMGWIMYDWANSSFATTVMAGFFPVFFKSYWSHGMDAVQTTAQLAATVSAGGLALALLTPVMGVLSDHGSNKKLFTGITMFFSVLSCFWMSMIPMGEWHQALWAYGIGYVAFTASCAFYDSLLPSVSSTETMDWVSSKGYSMGYLGGGILFLINVAMYLKPEFFGFVDGVQAVKFAFASVGIWWLVFSIPFFLFVKEEKGHRLSNSGSLLKILWNSLVELKKTLIEVKSQKNLWLYLLAFWLYIDGVYTVITMAVDFGISIGLTSQHLIAALLLTQFVGFPMSYAYGYFAKKWGLKRPLLSCIGVYSLAVILATQMSSETHFYLLAIVIGAVQGGVQALSRSLFGKMIPANKSGEYFGLMNVVGKFASILGPLLVAGTVMITQDSRKGLLGLLILFGLGGVLLWQVKEPTVQKN